MIDRHDLERRGAQARLEELRAEMKALQEFIGTSVTTKPHRKRKRPARTTAPEAARKPVRGELLMYVRDHVDMRSDNLMNEARRLVKELRETRHVDTTEGSVRQAIRVLQQRNGNGSAPLT